MGSLVSKEKQREQREWGELKREQMRKVRICNKRRRNKRKGGEDSREKIKLSPPCKHLGMNYLDPETFLLNTKHLINT